MSAIERRNYGKSHTYYLRGEDGSKVKLDGVTTLIGDGLAKPALINWAGNTTAAYAVDHWDELHDMAVSERLSTLKGARFADRDQAAAKGTLIHSLAEQIIAGGEVEVPEEVAAHVDSAVRFLDEWKIRPILTETTVYSAAGGYAGTLDMVITSDLLPGRVVLADWKTSRSGIYSEAALQLAAYGNAEFYEHDGKDVRVASLGITDHWGVWIRADGYDVYELDRSPKTFETFRYIATVARRAREFKESPLKSEALVRPAVAA